MTATMTPKTNDKQAEREIRALLDRWAKALEAKDLDGLMADYLPDLQLFDVKPPVQIRSAAALRALWQACLPFFPGRFRIERKQLELTVGADVAFAHFVLGVRPIGEQHPAGGTWLRGTSCFRRIDGAWRIAHEHCSIPVDFATGTPAFITDPDAA